jgi:glycosyltransferase involved in cell wall biosynthesis
MLSHRFYYGLKPYVPWRVRMALRRLSARRKREQFSDVWPIDRAATKAPTNWRGWPQDKKFAFVISHDVEGPAGLAKCERLAALEEQMGFRSCFNFIPEGEYSVPATLRASLTARGFEVGVHDLQHDGKLFRSRRDFELKAARINGYLRDWNVAGFRSGFMLRNLEWLHDLNIRYDSSTFDTDPFEPQSDGAGTIFPFWISARGNSGVSAGPASNPSPARGYMELPYTLPQDSTLFLVLQEKSAEIWLRKLDWLAAHGGMALVNVHPDYLRFDEAPSSRTYPVEHYIALLEHVRSRYAGTYWHSLPRQVAEFATALGPRLQFQRARRVCMVTHSFYESDNRVTRYAEALAARGDVVDVLALRRSPQIPTRETIEGVTVHRIQNRFGKTERSRLSYLRPLLRFLILSAGWITRAHRRQPYDLLHIHNMPDFLVFAGWFPRITGARLLLDIHDIVPEFYTTKFSGGKPGVTTALLHWIERYSARFAHHVIVSNHLWLEKYAARTGSQGKCSVFINNVNTCLFQPQPRTRNDGKLIILFPGGLQWHQGLDIALRSFRKVSVELPQAEFHIYGDGNMKSSLIALAAELGFNGQVRFFEPVRVKEIARVMANADLGVVPKRADSFGNEAYSTKIMEFMALGVPVVVSNTKIDRFYFDDSVVRFFESGNVDALATAMLDVLGDRELRQRMTANASAYSSRQSWELRKTDYLSIVDELIETGRAKDRGAARPFLSPPIDVLAARPAEIPTNCPVAARS